MATFSFRILTALLGFLAFATLFAQAADVIVINEPSSNQHLPSNTEVSIKYTVVGAQAGKYGLWGVDAYYPNSLNVNFQWIQNSNQENVISFSAASGLTTDPAPAGLVDKQYSTTWKTPNCHFFTRYTTSDYTFSLVFIPNYPVLNATQTAPGPQQAVISVPVTIQVNNGTFPKC
ncbi:hypothetical protein BX666DRAFT_1860837 [Dichotomocladium elegans]|nr:hypothetical protein BX666DRAFT_1860837 [Dichotomocladium elegans]